jgi:hypothetical protein
MLNRRDRSWPSSSPNALCKWRASEELRTNIKRTQGGEPEIGAANLLETSRHRPGSFFVLAGISKRGYRHIVTEWHTFETM